MVATQLPTFSGLGTTLPWSPLAWLRAMRAHQRRRGELLRLLRTADYLLVDIGLDADRARAEIDKPFWRR